MSIHATDQQGTPTGVAHVSTSKNFLNMQSGSNGEYLGTTSQKTYSGKNLFNSYVAPNYTLSDGTITVDSDGIISMSGNTRNNGYCRIYTSFSDFAPSLVAGQTYYIYVNNEFDQGNRNYIYLYGSSFFWNSGQPHTVTQTELDANIALYGGYQATTKLTIMVTTVSDTSYEPYVGGVPSPNPDYPQEIVTGELASKNLLDKNNPNLFSGYFDGDISSPTIVSGVAARNRIVFIPCKPNTAYSMSLNSYDSSDIAQIQIGTTSVFPTAGVSVHTLGRFADNKAENKTTPNDAAYLLLRVQSIQGVDIGDILSTILAALQIEEGPVATSFEPYFTPIELTQVGDSQDRVYKSGSNWYVERVINGMKLDSSTNFIPYTGVSDTGFTFFKATIATPKGQQCISNYFTTSYTGWSNLQNQHIEMLQVYTNDSLYLKTKTSRISSVETLNTWLSNMDVRAYYILATTTDTAITDSATIAWLNKYDTNAMPHHKYVNTRRTTYVGASGLASAIDLYDGSYASALPTYSTANDHHLTTANGGTYTVSLQNISASIISGTVTFSVFTNQRKIDFSWNGSATSTSVSISLQANEYIKSIYAYIPQDTDAGITLSQQLESGSLTDFEPYYNIVRIYAGDDLVFEDTSLTD